MKELPWSQLYASDELLNTHYLALRKSQSLVAMVWAVWLFGLAIANRLLSQELAARASVPTQWTNCPKCHGRLRSKGMLPRQIQTLVGLVHFERRVGRCRNRCQGVLIAPLDQELGLKSYQQTSQEVVQLGCLLAVFVPFETATVLLQRLTGIHLSVTTVWNWVQSAGQKAMEQLQLELELLASGIEPAEEKHSLLLKQMPLIIGADGVMVPIRPQEKSPKGQTIWREVKVAILARLKQRINSKGKSISQLHHRRLVAVLGDIEALKPRLWLEALRCDFRGSTVAWLSDGGRGFWRLYQECFSQTCIGILDFYHAAQNLWKAAAAALDGRTIKARQWFKLVRHQLRHGESEQVIAQLAYAIEFRQFPVSVVKTLTNVHDYLETHRNHINYKRFKELGLPLGSGMVESACKWLIQQRFKGVGMRWSEDGFNHLLHLRLAWVNQRFDNLFPELSSPNR